MSAVYELGPFRLDTKTGVLSKGGEPVALGSRAVAVLATLVERSAEFVPKGAIMDAAWPGLIVEESNLAVQISAIRRALADAPGGERWIETLARRGYRFVGPVTEIREREPKAVATRGEQSNLPAPLTSFIGRERELVEIKRLLPANRLVTIVGVGGIGKTRLALQVAAEVVDAYHDGVWLVELGSIKDPLLVPASVAQVLGVQERAGRPVADTLCGYLKSRQLLLILDNCEHLLDACTRLADAVLRGTREVTIVVTSREPFQLAGEQTYPLPPLSLPDPSAGTEAMARSEAVQLLVERVKRQLPDFELTATRAPAIAQLCIHLDGIPLALELAAARVRSLSIEQINARLNDRFKLLTGGSRTALPRQQTLRATLDWSYDLLAEDERRVLRRLSIFPSSFTLEAASAVSSDDALDEFAVIDLLSQLVARSLIVADTTDRGGRYRFLETTRAYALEKLAETEEVDAMRGRHAQYFRDRFEHAYDEWSRMSDAEWRAVYLPELDNVRVALDWALGAAGDPAVGISLAGASGSLWQILWLWDEGATWLEAAIACVGAQTRLTDQARLWFCLGILQTYSAPIRAMAALERAVDLYRRASDPSGLGPSLRLLGRERVFTGQFEQATLDLAEAFPLLERDGLPRQLAGYFGDLGALNMLTGDLTGARMNFERADTIFRDIGAESARLVMLLNLGDMTWMLGDLDAATVRFCEAAELIRRMPFIRRDRLGVCLTNLAGVHIERGDLDKALVAAREGLPLCKEAGSTWNTLDHLALRAALVGKVADAARLAGYMDSTFAAKGQPRQPNEARARDRLRTLLQETLTAGELQRLLAEGAKMTEDEACSLALEE
ncbi:MAG TPA: winged helix-turn-helix domain-containing protein [Casimicrobiaceae bacterium]|nr:winged helix-turn-helix domain-containing protein [Casimicrobiaceae bacterium]